MDADAVNAALKKLQISDPYIRVVLKSSGETVLFGAGELHLETCIQDVEKWAHAKVTVQEPNVPFRETISDLPAIQLAGKADKSEVLGRINAENDLFEYSIRVLRIPDSLLNALKVVKSRNNWSDVTRLAEKLDRKDASVPWSKIMQHVCVMNSGEDKFSILSSFAGSWNWYDC